MFYLLTELHALMMSLKVKKPLVVLLDSSDCSIEYPILKDVAEVTFDNAKYAKDLTPKIFNEAFIVCLWYRITLTEDDLKRFKALKLIICIETGYDNVDIKAAGKLGIAVCDVPGYDVEETADSTMSLILSLYRKTYWFSNIVREGQQLDGPDEVAEVAQGCIRIFGKTLGIVGFGRVGIAVALRAKAFGFNIVFYDPCVADGFEKPFGFERMNTLQDLLCCSNCITLHCALNDTNYHLINRQTINLMRPGSFLVNTAQGGLVNESDLACALKSGQIGAAALDVHEKEPYNAFEGPLKDAPNLICTPHAAWCSDPGYKELREMTALQIREAVTGKLDSLKNCVNKKYLIK